MRTLYIVGNNSAGYLPETDVYYVRTIRGAEQAARADAMRDKEDLNGDEAESRYLLSGSRGDYWLSCSGHGATYHYWVHPVMAERRTAPEDTRCVNCGIRIAGDRAYYVPETGAYLGDCC